MLAGLDPVPAADDLRALEAGTRSLLFRLRKPNLDQRLRYGLDRQGNLRPELYAEYRRS